MYEAIRGLSEAPNRFAMIPEAAELGLSYRCVVYHSHRIIYAVLETNQRVIVHRIYHSARKPLSQNDVP